MQEGLGRTWREIADHHHAELLTELSGAFDAQMNEAIFEAVAEERRQAEERQNETLERTRRAISDDLNQTLRRLRQSPSQASVFTLLAEASSPWANAVVVLTVEDESLRVAASRGLSSAPPESIVTKEAPALGSVIDNTEPVVTIATPSEVSSALSEAFGENNKCHLLPITVRRKVAAILIASGDVLTGAVELLTESAGMRLESLNPVNPPALKPLASSGLVQIGPTPKADLSWDDLSAADQKAHLNAQRVARVRVAEIRLYHPDELRQGVFDGNIYKHLREPIDNARSNFLQNCLAQSPTLVDYLHLEILRSLAHDDERLLGSDYPGPMV